MTHTTRWFTLILQPFYAISVFKAGRLPVGGKQTKRGKLENSSRIWAGGGGGD